MVFALLLARIHLRAAQGETPRDQEFKVLSANTLKSLNINSQVLMRGGEKGGLEGGSPLPGLTEEQTVAVTRQANIFNFCCSYFQLTCARLAAAIPAFKNLAKACTNPAIASWLALPQPETEVGIFSSFFADFLVLRGLMTRFPNSVLFNLFC